MRETLTHKKLQDWVKEIEEESSNMVVVLYDEGIKPILYEDDSLNGEDYLGDEDKVSYLINKGIEKDDILLPITKEVIDKVSDKESTKSVVKIEKFIYDLVVEINESNNNK